METKKKPPVNRALSKLITRNERAAFRLSDREAEVIDRKASESNLTRSEFIRRAALAIPVHSVTDHQMVAELKRLGGLMKHQYPKHSNWLDHEKRDYWQLMTRLNELARQLQENILNGQ